VFVLKGEDLLLNVTEDDVLQDVFSFSWKFKENQKVLIVHPGNNPNVFPDYTGRIEFLVNNFSVKLKNLQEADSGVYSAVVTKLSGEETEAAKYKIKVQGRFVNLSNTDRVSVVLFLKLFTCFFPPQIERLSLSSQ